MVEQKPWRSQSCHSIQTWPLCHIADWIQDTSPFWGVAIAAGDLYILCLFVPLQSQSSSGGCYRPRNAQTANGWVEVIKSGRRSVLVTPTASTFAPLSGFKLETCICCNFMSCLPQSAPHLDLKYKSPASYCFLKARIGKMCYRPLVIWWMKSPVEQHFKSWLVKTHKSIPNICWRSPV